jgi:UDP-2,3-diacylglucosamine hydrolase
VTTVLGTAVLDGGTHDAAILISDLHVPAGGGPVVESLRAALAAARETRASVFVLGDLFDTYVSRRQVRTGVWQQVAEAFAGASAAGCSVALLHGNRDFLLGPEFAEAARARIVPGGLRVRLGGVDTLLLHGDELCQNDLPYQRAKRWLRNPALGFVARRLPLSVALSIAERARRRSREVIASGDQRRFLPTAAALDAAFATGTERLVFGHIHSFRRGPHGKGEYWVLPAFDESAVGLLARQGRLEPVRFRPGSAALETVAVPGPLPLGAPPEGPAAGSAAVRTRTDASSALPPLSGAG